MEHVNNQGWLKTLHGGIQATLMDELGGWIVNRKLQTAGMTTNLTMKYRNPVPTGEGVEVEIRGRIKEMKRNFAFIEATLSCQGKVCSSCEMTYFCFPKDKAEKKRTHVQQHVSVSFSLSGQAEAVAL